MNRLIVLLSFSILLPGCLRTMADLRQDGDMNQTVPPRKTAGSKAGANAESAKPAPVTTASRFEEYDEQLRLLTGRLEVVENAVTEGNAARQGAQANESKEKQALEQKFQAYEEELKRLGTQIQALNEELARLKAPPKPVAVPVAKGRGPFQEGEEHLSGKKWKEAIVAFQKYRDGNPKGKMYADATYKIGLAFQELGMKDEARAFFEEVTVKFPNSKESQKAAVRLKTLK